MTASMAQVNARGAEFLKRRLYIPLENRVYFIKVLNSLTRNYNFLKHATQNVAGDILVSKVGFRRLMNHIYIYTTSPLQRRETSTRVTSRSSSFL